MVDGIPSIIRDSWCDFTGVYCHVRPLATKFVFTLEEAKAETNVVTRMGEESV
jgi:hypothetical protein